MNSDKNTPRLLGGAFLLQAIASAVGAFVLIDPLIVAGEITESMANIMNHPLQMRAGLVLQMITAIGIVMLGALLYIILRKQNNKIALVALGLYIMEATILAASRIAAFALLQISQESVLAGHPAYLQTLGTLLYKAADLGDWLHMLVFGLGATLFYALLYTSRAVPRVLSLWGLVAAPVAFVGTLLVLLGYVVPIAVFVPNLPFELAIGLWFLVKGNPQGKQV